MNVRTFFTTVTPFSKYLALSLFIIFPIIGFFLGRIYERTMKPLPVEPVVLVPSPTPTSLTQQTQQQWNPSKTFAFYYKSDLPVFLKNYDPTVTYSPYVDTDNPFKVCFGGDNRDKSRMIYKGKDITAHVMDVTNQKEINLSSVAIFTPNSCATVTSWINDKELLRTACGGDNSSGCSIDIIDVTKNSTSTYANTYRASLPFIIDAVKFPEWKDKEGSVTENKIGSFTFTQFCNQDNTCEPIKVFKNLPATASFPYKGYQPIATISTTSAMKEFDIQFADNQENINKKATVKIGSNGKFVFDLKLEKVILLQNKDF